MGSIPQPLLGDPNYRIYMMYLSISATTSENIGRHFVIWSNTTMSMPYRPVKSRQVSQAVNDRTGDPFSGLVSFFRVAAPTTVSGPFPKASSNS